MWLDVSAQMETAALTNGLPLTDVTALTGGLPLTDVTALTGGQAG